MLVKRVGLWPKIFEVVVIIFNNQAQISLYFNKDAEKVRKKDRTFRARSLPDEGQEQEAYPEERVHPEEQGRGY